MDDKTYCRLGLEKQDHHPDDVWELVVSDFVQAIDPKQYFITSGDAVQKSKRLVEDFKTMTDAAIKFNKLLMKAKGPATYLETEWTAVHGLLIKRKDPRSKKKKKE
jgi:hypothetical protein